jgi:hypothetical protein
MTRLTLLAAVAIALICSAPAAAQIGGPFDLTWNTFDGGGGTSSGGAFTLMGTIGQPDAGVMTGGAFELRGGFWPGAGGATPPCVADFNGDSAVNSQDFFDFLSAFFGSDPAADVNSDGVINSQDFFDFLTAFFAGC